MKTPVFLLLSAGALFAQPGFETTPIRPGMSWKYQIEYYRFQGVGLGYGLVEQGIRSIRVDSAAPSGAISALVTIRDSGAVVGADSLFDQESRYRITETDDSLRLDRVSGPGPRFAWFSRYFYKAPILAPDRAMALSVNGADLEFFRLKLSSSGGIPPLAVPQGTNICIRSIGAVKIREEYFIGHATGQYVAQILIEHNGRPFDYAQALGKFDSARAGDNRTSWEPVVIYPNKDYPYTMYFPGLGKTGKHVILAGNGGYFRSALGPVPDTSALGWSPISIPGDTIFSLASNERMLFATASQGIFTSGDAGNSWTLSYQGCGRGFIQAFGDFLAVDGSDRLCVSGNGGADWNAIASPPKHVRLTPYPFAFSDPSLHLISGMTIAITGDTGKSWDTLPIRQYSLRSIAADPPLIVASGANGVSISRDGGRTWGLDLVGETVNSVIVAGDTLVVGANSGAYLSPDQGRSWFNISIGLVYQGIGGAVNAMLYRSDTLYCAGARGVFRIPFRNLGVGLVAPRTGGVRGPAFRIGRRGTVLVVDSRLGAARLEIRDLRGKLLAAKKVPSGGGPVEFLSLPRSTLLVTGLRLDGSRVGSSLVPGGLR